MMPSIIRLVLRLPAFRRSLSRCKSFAAPEKKALRTNCIYTYLADARQALVRDFDERLLCRELRVVSSTPIAASMHIAARRDEGQIGPWRSAEGHVEGMAKEARTVRDGRLRWIGQVNGVTVECIRAISQFYKRYIDWQDARTGPVDMAMAIRGPRQWDAFGGRQDRLGAAARIIVQGPAC